MCRHYYAKRGEYEYEKKQCGLGLYKSPHRNSAPRSKDEFSRNDTGGAARM